MVDKTAAYRKGLKASPDKRDEVVRKGCLLGRGLSDWLAQRATALVLAAYIFFLMGFFLTHPQLDFTTWRTLFAATGMRVFSLLFWLALSWHAWIGLWTVVTDYVKPPAVRLMVLGLILLALALMLGWALVVMMQ
jgi:succinate dehydrogenase / fumarate reductase membrane anchor subunit